MLAVRSEDDPAQPRLIVMLLVIALAILTRLPQLLSPYLILDGDESILGLMARHLAAGRELPLFFYGQHYGLSIVEAAAGAVSFGLAGSGAVPLKAAMLALWTAGAVAFLFAATRILGRSAGSWTTALLLLHPAWAVWSMKARGGYITAFTASALLLALVVRPSSERRPWTWALAGLLTSIVYLAQPMWLPGVLPAVVYCIARDRQLSPAAWYLAGVAATIIPIRVVIAFSSPAVWEPPALGNSDPVGSLGAVVEQLYVSLTGYYYLRYTLPAPAIARWLAYAWCTILMLLMVVQAWRLSRQQYLAWSHLLCAGAVATIAGNWLLVEARDARYLLPLSTILVLWTAVEAMDLSRKERAAARVRTLAAACLLGLGAVAIVQFRDFSYLWANPPGSMSEERRVKQVIGYLKSQGVSRVFSLHGLFQWQLMFYSDEEVLARWTADRDRYARYVAQVDRAFRRGDRVALVGYVDSMRGLDTMVDPADLYMVDGKYFVYLGPDETLLRRLQFRFAAPGQ